MEADGDVDAVTADAAAMLFAPLLAEGLVMVGTADDAGSLISHAVAGAVTKAAVKASIPTRRFPRDRDASAVAT